MYEETIKGLIKIANDGNRIDWNAIRAEYIAGGTSYRKLAEKYGINKDVVGRRAKAEGWGKARKKAQDKAKAKSIQKTADAAADNAVIAERIKRKLLIRLEREIDRLPDENIGTEAWTETNSGLLKGRIPEKTSGTRYKIRDLTAAWKDLTEDMPKAEEDKNAPIFNLIRRLDDECGI